MTDIKYLTSNAGWIYPEQKEVVVFLNDDELPDDLKTIKIHTRGHAFVAVVYKSVDVPI